MTILYADIVGFTAWSSERTPTDIVGMLSTLFTQFDKMCIEYSVYKVHTIGDCYVVMGFKSPLYRNIFEECLNVVSFAQGMLRIIDKVNVEYNSDLNMRVGLHTGRVIAGLTGTQIVRYDIYGPDVAIANKMESEGAPGMINISEVTKELLECQYPDRFGYVDNKEIEIGALNQTIKSYFISPEVY